MAVRQQRRQNTNPWKGEVSDGVSSGRRAMRKFSSTRRSDLPDDLLELIEHTTKGVQRLYESTKSASGSVLRGQGQVSSPLPSYSSCSEYTSEEECVVSQQRIRKTLVRPCGNDFASRVAERRLPSAAAEVAGVETTKNSYGGTLSLRPQSRCSARNGCSGRGRRHSAGEGCKGMSQRQLWGYSQPLSVGRVDTVGSSQAQTGSNTTVSFDKPHRDVTLQHSTSRPQMSTSGAFSNSAAFGQDHSSSVTRRSWKDAFRSLLTDEVKLTAGPDDAIAEATSSRSPTPFTLTEDVVGNAASSHRGAQDAVDDAASNPRCSHSPFMEPAAEAVGRLKLRLREQEVLHREELSELRNEHRMEISRLRRTELEARQRTLDEVTAQLQSSADVKIKLLRAEVEGERQRADDVQKMLEEGKVVIDRLRTELDGANNSMKLLRRDLGIKTKTISRLSENLDGVQRELADSKREIEAHLRNLSESGKREKVALSREKEQRDAVKQLELQLSEQGRRSREELARVEEELRSMSDGYEKLIKEAAEKLTVLERVERKYHALKEQHRGEKKQNEAVTSETAALKEEKEELRGRVEKLQDELEELRLQLARKEHELREERVGHNQTVDEMMRAMEQHQEKATLEREGLQKAVRSAEERLARSQRAAEGLERQLQDEQKHSKELLLKLEEGTLRHQEELATTRRSATSYHQQAEGVISSLKRQLREKDAKLEALANTASEPLQRLRNQLEDERSKRARLEEQFNQYKQKAKLAQETALREVRREQQRTLSVGRIQPKSTTAANRHVSVNEEGDLMFPTPPSASSASPAGTVGVADVSPVPTPTLPYPDRGGDVVACARHPSVKAVAIDPRGGQMLCGPHECNTVTPTQRAGHRSGWDSVGSISNISCSSPLCSSRFGDLRSVDESVTSMGDNWLAARPAASATQTTPVGHSIDERTAQHELVLQEFHKSAAEVFRKITGNREEFLARCTSAVRSASHHTADREQISADGGEELD